MELHVVVKQVVLNSMYDGRFELTWELFLDLRYFSQDPCIRGDITM